MVLAEGAQGRLTACEVAANGGDGIMVGTSQSVVLRDCTVRDNRGAGLRRTASGELLTVENLTSQGNAEPNVSSRPRRWPRPRGRPGPAGRWTTCLPTEANQARGSRCCAS